MERKYASDQRVRIKNGNGGHKPPSDVVKGVLGTIVQQCESDWLGSAKSPHAESPRSYYVQIEGGTLELIGEDWLELARL